MAQRNRHITEARDTNKNGFYFNRFLVEFNLARDLSEANSLIRAGSVELNGTKIKDIQFHVEAESTYDVRVNGEYVAEATVI